MRDGLALVGAAALGAKLASHLLHHANEPQRPVLAALTAHADSVDTAPRSPNKLVLAVLDGVGDAALSRALSASSLPPPSFEAHVDTGTPSLSRPGYHVMLTGVPQAVSGVRTNQHAGPARADTVADRVRAHGGTVAWALTGVRWMHDLGAHPGETFLHGSEAIDEAAFARAASSTLVVLHIVETDAMGHEHGAASPQYRDAVERAVATVARLRALSPDAAWFVGADHGHTATGGHGGPEPEVTSVAWYGYFPGSPAPVVHRERVPADRLAATFASAAGVEPPRHALGDALPLPVGDPAPPPRERVARRRAVAEAARDAADTPLRALSSAPFALTLTSRRALAAVVVPLAALAAYYAAGTGTTLSAMAEVPSHLARTGTVMTLGAALGWVVVRARTDAWRVALAAALFPIAGFVAHRGALSEALGSAGLFGALVAGVVPAGCLVAVALVELFAALRRVA